MNFVDVVLQLAPNGTTIKGVFTTRKLQDLVEKAQTTHEEVVSNWDSIETELDAKGVVVFPAPVDVEPQDLVRVFKKESRLISLLDALLFPSPSNNVTVATAVKKLAQND